MTPRGVYIASSPTTGTWAGATSPTAAGSDGKDCFSWTSSGAFAQGTGFFDHVVPVSWFDTAAAGTTCSLGHHLYCLQF